MLFHACGQYNEDDKESDLKANVPKKPNSKLAATDRRRQLVEIAMELIAAKGFEGLRFQEVAKQAGINNATLFYHFRSKEELIMGVMQHLLEELQKTPGLPADRPATAPEELRLEFASVGDLLTKRPKLFVALTELSLRAMRDPALASAVKIRDHFWRQHLSGILRRGIKDGAFRADVDVETAVASVMAQIKGIGFHAVTGKLKAGEVRKAVADIAGQAECWLTRGIG